RLVGDSAALVGELRQTRGQLDGALADGRAALQEARQVVGPAGLGQTLASLDRLSTRGYLLLLQSQEQLAEALGHLQETAENMEVFSQRIRDDPSLLLLGGPEEGAAR
ncbi:MAG: hypothetical protein RBU45_26810, partial [Myxococcota bacterium]|nr:hypothetical protein [Myxococcota bacterium]